jgi:hypothetical protein
VKKIVPDHHQKKKEKIEVVRLKRQDLVNHEKDYDVSEIHMIFYFLVEREGRVVSFSLPHFFPFLLFLGSVA